MEQDSSIRRKSRIVSKGFQQIPGVDYSESFSPVANETSTCLALLLTLFNQDKGWECDVIDIEAAFLEGEIDTPSYLDWPDGIELLGFIAPEEKKTTCIKLVKSIYGNVDAAL